MHLPSGALMFLLPVLSCSDTFTEGRSWGSEICCGSEICGLHAGLCVSYRRCKCAYGNLAASAGHAVPNWTGAWRSTPHTDQLFSEGNRPKRTNDDLQSWWLPREIDWWVPWVCRKKDKNQQKPTLGLDLFTLLHIHRTDDQKRGLAVLAARNRTVFPTSIGFTHVSFRGQLNKFVFFFNPTMGGNIWKWDFALRKVSLQCSS